jgi:hypothetical protein
MLGALVVCEHVNSPNRLQASLIVYEAFRCNNRFGALLRQ